MQKLQEKQKYIPWKYNPRSIEWQCQASVNKSFKNNNGSSLKKIKEEYGVLSKHTKRCEIISRINLTCNEPVSYTTLKYRHQHQQHILKQLRHRLQRFSSQYNLTSQTLSESSPPQPSISATDFFHLIFSGWNKKPNKLSTRIQSKSKFSFTSRTRSIIGQLHHQNKNSTEKPAGKLLRRSSSNRGGIIEKKQFDREYNGFLRTTTNQQQQQQQRTQQVKHIEFLLYNAFVKNTLTARKH